MMTSLDHSSAFPAAERPTERRGVVATVLGIVALLVIGLGIVVAVVCKPANMHQWRSYSSSSGSLNPSLPHARASTLYVAAWRSDNGVRAINEVTLRRALLVGYRDG